ncbi:MAG TPA: hypothetical protein VMD99_14500 [Terriglobales bacterium]|nr:hypothetical protein [Terriglobales bacterium]
MSDLFGAMVLGVAMIGVSAAQEAKPASPATQSAEKDAGNAQQYSGMYTFLKEGEFVQVTVEDDGIVTGFISRYGDGETDKDTFLDQFFKSGKIDGNKLSFTTKIVHSVWFEFAGAVERGDGKNPGDEGYFVLKGRLTENVTDAKKKVTSKAQDVVFRMIPGDSGEKK